MFPKGLCGGAILGSFRTFTKRGLAKGTGSLEGGPTSGLVCLFPVMLRSGDSRHPGYTSCHHELFFCPTLLLKMDGVALRDNFSLWTKKKNLFPKLLLIRRLVPVTTKITNLENWAQLL